MAFCFLPHPSRLLQEYWDLVWKPHDIHSGFIGNLGEVLVGDFHQLVCGSPQGAPFLQSPPVGRVGLGHLVVEVLPRRFPETLRLLFVVYLASDPLVQRARVEQEAQAFLGDEAHHMVEVWSCRTIPPGGGVVASPLLRLGSLCFCCRTFAYTLSLVVASCSLQAGSVLTCTFVYPGIHRPPAYLHSRHSLAQFAIAVVASPPEDHLEFLREVV